MTRNVQCMLNRSNIIDIPIVDAGIGVTVNATDVVSSDFGRL